jgi:hypothetical protein
MRRCAYGAFRSCGFNRRYWNVFERNMAGMEISFSVFSDLVSDSEVQWIADCFWDVLVPARMRRGERF